MYESVTHFLPQHTSTEARCAAAGLLREELLARATPGQPADGLPPIAVDTLSNAASIAYGALPERLVLLQGGIVRFIGGKGPEEYSIDEAAAALASLLHDL